MSQSEIEKMNFGAPDYTKKQEELEQSIRKEVESSFPHLPSEMKEAIIISRIKSLNNTEKPNLVKVDLGENAGKKTKEGLFE